jgi:alpha-glucosidase
MQWGATEHAGFTTGEPWLPLDTDYHHQNAAALAADPHSILSLYVKLIDLRKHLPELVFGSYEPVDVAGDVLAYRRVYDGKMVLIALNLSGEPVSLHLGGGEILLATGLDRHGENVSGALELSSNEGAIVRLR